VCERDPLAPAFEVLVVDNHPRRTSEGMIVPFLGENLRLLWEPKPGKCRAVNRGIEAARGSVLHFTDQDNVPCEGYLGNLWRAFRENPELTVMTGRVETEGTPLAAKRSSVREVYQHPFVPSVVGHGNNLSVRRDAIEDAGRLDPRFGPGTFVGAGEDTDFLYRLGRAGHRVLYEPSVCNVHAHGRDDPAAIWRTRRDYARGRGAFYLKHLRRGDRWVARLCYWELRACLAKSVPDPRGNLRGLLAGMAWMAWH
jgi:GT2 family glycosyltransferase